MRYVLTVFLLFVSITDPITKISKVNGLKRDAKEAMEQKEYVKAVLHYIDLVDSMQIDDDNLKMNMASAAFMLSYGKKSTELKSNTDQNEQAPVQLDSTDNTQASLDGKFAVIAETKYLELVNSKDKTIASNAYNQRGIIAYFQSEEAKPKSSDQEESFEQSLEHFKDAMRNNPTNAAARYNYELLKKLKMKRDQQDDDDDLKPSEYAKMMKKLSDEERRKGQFKKALDTMMEALENDETVAAYKEYMEKLKVVADI